MKTIAVKEDEDLFPVAFKAVVVYDDISHAARAAASLERAAAGADPAMKCDLKLWRLEALQPPARFAITIAVAADANLIAFALNDAQSPPAGLLEWLECWSANRRIHDAAVTLLGPEADAAAPLQKELEQFAKQHGLAFFRAIEAWEDGTDAAGERAPSFREPLAEPVALPLEPMPAASHWGIND